MNLEAEEAVEAEDDFVTIQVSSLPHTARRTNLTWRINESFQLPLAFACARHIQDIQGAEEAMQVHIKNRWQLYEKI